MNGQTAVKNVRSLAGSLCVALVAVLVMPGIAGATGVLTIFDDDFQNTATGNATAARLNAGVDVGTWTVGNRQESKIQASGGARAIMMDQGSYNFTTTFAFDGRLDMGTTVTLDAALRRRNNAQKRNFIEGFDANNNVLFRIRVNAPSNNDTNTAVQYDNGPGYTDVAKPSLKWSSGYNTGKFRGIEITLADTYDIWVDENNNNVKNAGEFVTGLTYLNAPTADFDRLVFRGNSQAGARYDNILVTTVIPEPLTMLAVGLSIGGLGGYIRKRRRC